MRRLLVLALLLAGCGGSPGAEDVIRDWSAAVNAGEPGDAAQLFAAGAQVVQGARVIVFDSEEEARRWNAGLPCSGKIVRVEGDDDMVTADFLLSDGPRTPCDAPGVVARVFVRVRDGKIVLWHQLETSAPRPNPV